MKGIKPLQRVMSILCSNFPDENAMILLKAAILLLGLQSCDLALWVGWEFFFGQLKLKLE